jgi:hypothetical protein
MPRVIVSERTPCFFVKIDRMTSNLRIACSRSSENNVPVNGYRQDETTSIVGVFADEVDPPRCDAYCIGCPGPGLLERTDYPCG